MAVEIPPPVRRALVCGGDVVVGCFQKVGVYTPKSSIFKNILIGFSIINHPFWGFYPGFGNIHVVATGATS